jgi:hypothetical protein
MRGKTFVSGHASQTTKKVPKAKTIPASRAPPKRMPSWRPNRYIPNEPTNSLIAAMIASAFHSGSTYDGSVNGEKIADWAFAR